MSDLLNSASLVMIPSGYAEDKVYSVVPSDGSGDLSFTRASNGTRVNSAGLVEVCPWNLFTYSEDFANADWVKVGSTISSNVLVAPNGTTTAEKLVEDTSNGVHIALQINASRNVNSIYAFSVYAKAGERTKINLFNNGNGSGNANFDLSNGTATLIAGEFATIESVGNGWYRCVVGMQENSTVGNFNYHIRLLDASGNDSYTGNGTSGAYIWGAQVNLGTAKPYFPTTDRLNVPRLTYQNGGGGCPSLLLEKQSTNLITYSEQFDNAAWSKSNVTITANNTTSPDGTINADLATATSGGELLQGLVLNTSTSYSFSFYVKKGTATDAKYRVYNFDAGVNVVSPISYISQTNTSTWVRVSVSFTSSATGVNYGIYLLDSASAGTMYFWGAQVEASSYPTSYIPTTSSSATRVADACSKTGISSLIGQTEGVIYIDVLASAQNVSGLTYGFFYLFGDSTNNIQLYYISGILYIYVVASSSVLINTSTSQTITANTRYKIAMAYKSGQYALYINGSQILVNTASAVPAMSQFNFNATGFGALAAETPNNYNEFILFPTRLTNAELASLTTI